MRKLMCDLFALRQMTKKMVDIKSTKPIIPNIKTFVCKTLKKAMITELEVITTLSIKSQE